MHYVEAALREVAKVTDPVERDLYIQQLAKDYHLNPATLTGQVQELAATAAPRPAYPENSLVSRGKQDAALSIHAPHHNYRAEYPGATAVGEGRIGSATAPAGDIS